LTPRYFRVAGNPTKTQTSVVFLLQVSASSISWRLRENQARASGHIHSFRPLALKARTSFQEVHDCRLSVARIRRRISIYLPRVPSGLSPIRFYPISDRVVRLVQAVVRAAVNGDGSLAPRRLGSVHLASSFKFASNLYTEVAQYPRTGLDRVVVEKNVVAASPKAGLAANERPHLTDRRSPN